jgi:hypothetical protein
MFMATSSPPEVLADIYVPFDCEFVVARQGENGEITLTEVYNIAKGRPLLSCHFGYWISETQYNFPSTDFYSRRPSLEGLLISAATFEVRKNQGLRPSCLFQAELHCKLNARYEIASSGVLGREAPSQIAYPGLTKQLVY